MQNTIILFENIKSQYIVDNIFNYIRDINFKLKLIKYSNKYHKILNVKLNDYKECYFLQFIDLDDYISRPSDFNYKNNPENNNFLQDDLLKYEISMDYFQQLIINYYRKYLLKDNERIGKRITIFSPVFDVLSKTEFFGDKFSININPGSIDIYNTKEYYINTFSKLNELNLNYSSIYYTSYKNSNTINYLKELGIDFNKIKKICFLTTSWAGSSFLNNNNSFLKSLFSIKILKKI